MNSRKNADETLQDELLKACYFLNRGKTLSAYTLTLIAITRYLKFLGLSDKLLLPLHKLRNELYDDTQQGKRAGHPARPFAVTYQMAVAVSTVTVLKERGTTVAEALKRVSDEAGIDKKKLKSFRDNLNRGLHDEATQQVCKQTLAQCRNQPLAEIFDGLKTLRTFVSKPRFF